MTWRDKLEIGLKEDAPYRKDNLPAFQVRGPETSAGVGRSPEVLAARTDPSGPPELSGSPDQLGDLLRGVLDAMRDVPPSEATDLLRERVLAVVKYVDRNDLIE
jgi:hypothetical protein